MTLTVWIYGPDAGNADDEWRLLQKVGQEISDRHAHNTHWAIEEEGE